MIKTLKEAEKYGGVYIYTFASQFKYKGDFPIKIGCTSHNIKSRIAAQGTGQYEKPLVLLIVAEDDKQKAIELEKILHSAFIVWKNTPGKEWFKGTRYSLVKLLERLIELKKSVFADEVILKDVFFEDYMDNYFENPLYQ